MDKGARAARAAGLRYGSDEKAGIRRTRSGAGFKYLTSDGRTIRNAATLSRIKSLDSAGLDGCLDRDGPLFALAGNRPRREAAKALWVSPEVARVQSSNEASKAHSVCPRAARDSPAHRRRSATLDAQQDGGACRHRPAPGAHIHPDRQRGICKAERPRSALLLFATGM